MRSVLVVSPHPDDESVGCGGTLREHVLGGDEVRIVFLTSGERGIPHLGPNQAGVVREAEAARAASILGISEFEFWRAPDGELRVTASLVDRLSCAIDDQSADVVYVTHPDESHADHRAAARIVVRAVSRCSRPPLVRFFEVWTPLARMDAIVDISERIEEKMAAIRAHASQGQLMAFDAAFLGLSRYRGEMHSWPGGPYAEVFSELPTGLPTPTDREASS